MKLNRSFKAALIAATVGLVASSSAWAQDFAGKTITVMAHTSPGGTYDLTARLLARHIGKHIPGTPNVVVENVTGAGGQVALNRLVTGCPGDGSCIMLFTPGLLTHELTQEYKDLPPLAASMGEVNWIGCFISGNPVYITWAGNEVKTIEDAKETVVRGGASGVSSANAQLPWSYNYLLGTKFEVIVGYGGAAEFDIGMQRGELDGRSVTDWKAWSATLPEETRSEINLLLQLGTTPDPRIPSNVPVLLDLVEGDPEKEKLVRLLAAIFSSMNLPFATGPDVPEDTVAVLRQAFMDTMEDPEFLADAERMNRDITVTSGEELQELVHETLSYPPETVQQFVTMMDDPRQ